MRRLFVALAVAVSQVGFAQDPAPRGELGLRYWLSTGETKRSHNAQGVEPSLGNPTSVLLYENLDANILELHGRLNFGHNWFSRETSASGCATGI